ncbi:MAG: hypothetical protein ACREA4_13060 [Nitrososphaera sp.]
MSGSHDEYRQEVMLTCKILLDSLQEGKRLELADLLKSQKKKLQFVANIVKLGDTFRSEDTQPIYGMLFTTEGEEYLMRMANEMGLNNKVKVLITIQPIEEKDGNVI